MKRETGKTDPSRPNDKVSIRLRSDGHSFPDLPAGAGEREGFEAVILGRKTTLVPASEFDPARAGDYLELCGLGCGPSEQPVWSAPEQGRIAVMAIERTLAERLPRGVRFSSPLLRPAPPRSAVLERREGLLFLTITPDREPEFAEVLRAEEDADALYYLTALERCFPLRALTLHLAGDNRESLRKVLKSKYKRIICE